MIGGTSRGVVLWSLGVAFVLGGCKADLCESKAPAFQLDLTLPASVRARIKSFRVDVTASGKHKEQLFNSGTLAGSETSVSVTVGAAGAAGFSAEVIVEARDDQGMTLAQAKGTFKGVGNACNFFKLVLVGNPPDAGADVPGLESPSDGPVDLPDTGQPDQPRDVGPRERPPDKPALDTRPPDGPKVDQPKIDMKKIDQPKIDMKKPDLPKPDLPKPDMKKPDQTVPLRTCDQIYSTTTSYHLCTQTATNCAFYASVYPSYQTCTTVCTQKGGTCVSASIPQSWTPWESQCIVAGSTTCGTSRQSAICTCTRIP
jgi:hypothetical protein